MWIGGDRYRCGRRRRRRFALISAKDVSIGESWRASVDWAKAELSGRKFKEPRGRAASAGVSTANSTILRSRGRDRA